MNGIAQTIEPRKQVAHYLLLVLSCLLITGSVLVSQRPITLANMPAVAMAGPVPDRADPARLGNYVRAYAAFVPNAGWRPQVRALIGGSGEGRVQVGYSLRQVSFLGLPFFAYPEAGYVLAIDDGSYTAIAALGKDGLAELERQTGVALPRISPLAFLRYGWGWMLPALVALFVWFELKWQARRREALGLI